MARWGSGWFEQDIRVYANVSYDEPALELEDIRNALIHAVADYKNGASIDFDFIEDGLLDMSIYFTHEGKFSYSSPRFDECGYDQTEALDTSNITFDIYSLNKFFAKEELNIEIIDVEVDIDITSHLESGDYYTMRDGGY